MNEIHDMAALYVVDALVDEEIGEFEIHLAECVECQEEVADMRKVTEELARSVQAEPPASLRSAVLAGIAVTSQEHDPSRTKDRTAPATIATEDAGPSNVVPMRRRWTQRVPSLAAAAAVLLALGFGGWAFQSRQDAQQASDARAELISLLGTGDVRTVSGTAPGGASGTVVLSRERDQAVFVSAKMPALPSDHVYELWTITDRPLPAGTFSPSSDGDLVKLPPAALSADQIAITVEPQGGSAWPTTGAVMTLDVPPAS